MREQLIWRSACGWLLAVAALCPAEQLPVSIDGQFGDWSSAIPAYQDPAGDGGSSGIDFGALWLADDHRFFFLLVEFGIEADASENNSLRLYLDTDADSQTGLAVAGIGAELEWRLGDRAGTFYYQSQTTTVDQADLRFRGAPTITADTFEFAVGRDAVPDGVHSLFSGPTVRVALLDAGGDQIPNAGETISYTLDLGQLPPETVIPLDRQCSVDLRIGTYNVLSDSPWGSGQEARFGRQLAAVDADILNFQEISNHSAAQTADLVGRWVSAGPGLTWHSAENNDCITVSRYPIIQTWPLDGNLAALIDTSAAFSSELLLINAHLPCCTNDSGRQSEIDRIMAFIRDAQQPGGTLDLAPDTPIIITGDLNLVGFAQQLTTLLTGDIVNEGSFGPDFTPDWDGTDLTSVFSRQTELRMGYTWRSDTSDFWPGQLDYQIFTDHVLRLANNFILYTPEMSSQYLALYGLQAADSEASDHLLFCVDFRSIASVIGDLNGDGLIDLTDLAALLANYGAVSGATYEDGDLDGDGDVDLSDLSALLAVYGTSCQ